MDTNTRRPRRITIFRRAGWLAVAAMVATGLFAAPGAAFAWSPPTITPLCSDVQGQFNWTVTLASGESNYNYQSSTDGTSWSSNISGASGSNALSTASATLYVRWSADTNSKTGPVVNTVGPCTTAKITICHATDSNANPYVINEPDETGDVSGHASHTGPVWDSTLKGQHIQWGDIIPPFVNGDVTFPGLNWDAIGQAIWNNNCKIPPPPTPVVSISKSNNTDGSVAAGSSVAYTLTLHVANGPAGATTIVDQLPTGIGSATSITGGGTYDAGTNKITWNLTSVTDGQQLTYTAVVSAGATSAGNPYTNTATISGCTSEGCSASSVVNVQVPPPPTPVVSISKSNNTDGSVAAGSSVAYTLTLHVANGPAGATTIVDQLPTGIGSATSITGGGTYDAGTNKITWNLTSVTDGQQLTYTAVVSAGATSAGNPYTNTATISGCTSEGCSASSVVNVQVPPPPTPVVSISKSNNTDGSVAAGSSVAYTLTLHVANGPAGATTIVDQLPTGIGSATSITGGGTYDAGTNKITWNLTSVTDGQQLTYTAVVSAGATSAGNPYTNTATISGCTSEGCSASSVVNVQVPPPTVCTVNCSPVVLTPALTVTKSVSLSQSGPFTTHSVTTTVGTTVWYQVTMTNTGQEALSGVTFTDSLGLPTSCPSVPTTLSVSASYTCTYSDKAKLGSTTNTVTGTSSQVGPKSDTATVIGTTPPTNPNTGGVAGATGRPHITPPPTSALGSVPAQPAGDTWRIALLGLAALLASLLVFSPKTSPERRRR